MPEVGVVAFLNFFIFLAVPFICALVAKRFHLPSLFGYLVGGVIFANFLGGFIDAALIDQIAFFGVALLLFAIGLEINFERMLGLKRFILIGGSLQVGISALAISLILLLFDFTFAQAVLIGIALSTSSTAIVVKMIQDRGEEGSFVGEMTAGILMFQNLAFIPFIMIFQSLQAGQGALEILPRLVADLAIAAVILVGVIYIGSRVVPILFDFVSHISRELLQVFAIVFILLIGLLFAFFQLPLLVGMFVAGVLVSQTRSQHHVFSRVRPLRDLLAIVFFIFIGSHVVVAQILPSLPAIILFTALALLVKGIIVFAIFLWLKFGTRIAFSTSWALLNFDEDAFIFMTIGLGSGIFSQDQYLFVIGAVLMSLLITPLMLLRREGAYLWLRKTLRQYYPGMDDYIKNKLDFTASPIDELTIKNHVIICGYGRVGETIGRALRQAKIPFIAIDYNFHTVEQARHDGVQIIYGDPTDIDVLDFAEAEEARCVIAAVPARFDQETIVINARSLNPKVYIVSRANRKHDSMRLRDLGAHTVVSPEFEASTSMLKRVLLHLGFAKDDIIKSIRHMKLLAGE